MHNFTHTTFTQLNTLTHIIVGLLARGFQILTARGDALKVKGGIAGFEGGGGKLINTEILAQIDIHRIEGRGSGEGGTTDFLHILAIRVADALQEQERQR